ncbi:2Fe-2S ferredoxin [Nostoc linckia z18]|uniref:2Fe-2S ferredoxin n=2 Tax=Nostoc linckia TaxID=92942 RepID=A0A9Q5Z4P6_NOSLI|nr:MULTISPECIES: aromatic ring-hydroxylating dioxygenase subunit alpha [Nostoc]PHK35624.1 2Fe-2S ferredoxin [Nostoc linckia z15]PHK41969.1 2Fe-2S ferredoxin [Nostoc linckia z16]MBC1236111.1 aromatic ring-hydroxylating dioxygenase subunit alpha [Nostoc sp. 2RC]PHJ54833.1 2Fe-2S ferredoxin [Nostoc linckia z1]PHJ56478.1 2Fe-2S ferredoxin [Nostoc linckia z3]
MKNNDNFFLRNIWYYALPSNHLKPGTMVSRVFLGEPVLLIRDRNGKVAAMQDICPHRGVPLSCGRFDGQEVECCYHGWRFNSGGRCTAIPSLVEEQQMDLSRFDVQSYTVREAQGNIWIYIPDSHRPQPPDFEMQIPVIPGFEGRSPQFIEIMRFPCFVDHAVVGLMDPAHSPYVHRAWWWRNEQLHEEVKQFDASPHGFTMRRHRLPANGGRLYWLIGGGVPETEISFRLPGVRVEETTIGKHRVVNLTTVTPISDTETEVTFSLYWTLPWVGFFQPLLHVLARTFLGQDRSVVEKQQIGLKYNPVLRLIKDSDVQAQWYYQLKREYARSIAEERQFVNPVKGQILRWRA